MLEDAGPMERHSISMPSLYWVIAQAYAKEMSYGGISPSLRRIIEEWLEFRKAELPFLALLVEEGE